MKLTVKDQTVKDQTVKDQIEELRSQMQKIAADKALTDPRVVRVSEKLDVLINEFYMNLGKRKGA